MGKISVDAVHLGDIVIFDWGGDKWHTALCVDGPSQDPLIAHCVNENVGSVVDSLTNHIDDAQNVYAFRLGAQAVAQQAVLLARGWVNNSPPRYDTKRGGSVLSVRYNYNQGLDQGGGLAPFGYDALFRVFKWMCREERFNNKDRGTTCCAFVMACFQAAAMRIYLESQGQFHGFAPTMLSKLRGGRQVKPKKDQFGDPNKDPYRIQNSNVGSTSQEINELPINTVWRTVRRVTIGYKLNDTTTLAEVMTPALFLDAKFTYSKALYINLHNHMQGWTQLPPG